MQVILQLGKSVTIATAAQLTGRLANVAIPLLVVAAAGVTPQSDEFFFILAVSFYFYGVLANAITQATVPLIISKKLPLHPIHVATCGVIVGVTVSIAAWLFSHLFLSIPRLYIPAIGLMSGAGIANGLASGEWHARELFVVPGLSWALRLIPLGVWYFWCSESQSLAWLAMGIGMADSIRAIVLTACRSSLRDQALQAVRKSLRALAPSFGMVILAALINGLNPIIDRIIAGLGETGSISILETGERVYMVLAGLATIGIATSLLPRLSLRAADDTLSEIWPDVLKFVGGWSFAWLLAGGLAGVLGFKWWLHSATVLTVPQLEAAQKVYGYYLVGLPFFTLALVYVKRLQALQRWGVMVITSSISVALNIPGSLILYKVLGVPGIALATTFIHVFNCALLIVVAHRAK